MSATYVLFVHAAADMTTNYLAGFADTQVDGNPIGEAVSEYSLLYADGSTEATQVSRRFGIQQTRVGWGASPTAAVPAVPDLVRRSITEELAVNGTVSYGLLDAESRHEAGRDVASRGCYPGEMLWIYALPNPHPERPLAALQATPRGRASAIYAITLTSLREHPLRTGRRAKIRFTLPDGASFNSAGEYEGLGIDLGTVISARAANEYEPERWSPDAALATPRQSDTSVVAEFVAHPDARLYTRQAESWTLLADLAAPAGAVEVLPPADRPVKVRVVDASTGEVVPARLHMHDEAGAYLPPRGHHRTVNPATFEGRGGDFVTERHQSAYIDGECVVELPLGEVFVEIMRGYEVAPIRQTVRIDADTSDLTFSLTRVLHWRERGWVTADTHVHFLSPQTALLEGSAEGVNVVNLLASQWGELFTNVSDFDGKTTFGATDFGGDGEFLVRVGSENRMQLLGHISLLGYSGRLIDPLCTGGPTESAIGDPLEVTMAEWAQRCRDQGGLVVMPHAPAPQLERAADFVLGLADANELVVQNPLALLPGRETLEARIDPYGIADWYRYLNLGHHLPIVGGSDKMADSHLLGGIRTYAQLGEHDFTYENWIAAIRAGNTFATIGPLAALTVEGASPGASVDLPGSGGRVSVQWRVESVAVPIARVEVIVGGLVAHEQRCDGELEAKGATEVKIDRSTWVALRVRGSHFEREADCVAAHTSAVQVVVDSQPLWSDLDAGVVLDQIAGAIAYVDTLATCAQERRHRQLRATLSAAYNRLHQRLHQAGIYHDHKHHPDRPHEH
ncbi:MAG: CehA/McbA family metallohydrolase [Solirubrobacteraceae bacterium]